MGLLKLLLDTHCWLWLKSDSSRLPSPLLRRLVRDPSRLVFSVACIMEIVIKHATGRLRLDTGPDRLVAEVMDDGVSSLAITAEHALRLATLPPRHRDPFDRLLVAQAQVEGLTLVSADADVLGYDVPTIDARE